MRAVEWRWWYRPEIWRLATCGHKLQRSNFTKTDLAVEAIYIHNICDTELRTTDRQITQNENYSNFFQKYTTWFDSFMWHFASNNPTDNTAQGLICFFLHTKTLPGTILPPIKKYLWSTWLNKRQQCVLDVYVIGTYSFGLSTVTSFSVLNQQQNCNDHELINWSRTNKFHYSHIPYSPNSFVCS